jgi:allophanate hydrolase subunit 1
LGNIIEIFSQMESITLIFAELRPQIERLIEILENRKESSNAKPSEEHNGLNS